jgi:hypothetical protein
MATIVHLRDMLKWKYMYLKQLTLFFNFEFVNIMWTRHVLENKAAKAVENPSVMVNVLS